MEFAFTTASSVIHLRSNQCVNTTTFLPRNSNIPHVYQLSNTYRYHSSPILSRLGTSPVEIDSNRRLAEYRRIQRGYDSGYRSDLTKETSEESKKLVWAGEGEGGESEFNEFVEQLVSNLFGNSGLFECERDTLEIYIGRLRENGDVREFIREVCKSDPWRARFWEGVSPLRFVEVLFKAVLGRAPVCYAEVREHMGRANREGFEKEIDAVVDSEEHTERFGRIGSGKVGIEGYRDGMRGFTRGMKLLAQSRGGKSDGALQHSLLAKHLGGNRDLP